MIDLVLLYLIDTISFEFGILPIKFDIFRK